MSCALIAGQYRASVYGIPAPLIVAPLTSGEKKDETSELRYLFIRIVEKRTFATK